MKQLPTLYSRTSNGNIQQWTIFSKGDSFWTEEGIVNGKLTTATPTICEGKNLGRANETSAEDQATKEAKARWSKKLKQHYFENIKDIDQVNFTEPMLAHKWNDKKDKVDITKGVYIQPKLDGVRCIINKHGMMSRNGTPILSAPHILAELKPYFEKYPDLIFDGELYCDKFKNDFNSIISLVRKTDPTFEDLALSAYNIEYWIYDLPSNTGIFSIRNKELQTLFKSNPPRVIKLLDTHRVTTQSEMDIFYEKWLSEGLEGQIIRLDKEYEFKRSKNLLKRKEFIDDEYIIISIEPGKGNKSGMAGYMNLKSKDGQKIFKSNIKGDFKFMQQLLSDKDSLVDKLATVRYFNLTPDGIPRFPYVYSIRDYE